MSMIFNASHTVPTEAPPGTTLTDTVRRSRLERQDRDDWDPALEADALCVCLSLARDRIAIPLARAALRFVDSKGWFAFGYARIEDHARERFGRSGRWVRDLAALAKTFAELPGLPDAMTGDDGGRPIGRVATLLIGRTATPSTLPAWIAAARSSTVRELREKVRSARAVVHLAEVDDTEAGPAAQSVAESVAKSVGKPGAESVAEPGAESAAESGTTRIETVINGVDEGGADQRVTLRFAVPLPFLAAFDETRETYHALIGGRTSLESFLEAVVAEAATLDDCLPEVLDVPPRRSPRTTREERLAAATENWAYLRRIGHGPDVFQRAARTLREIELLCGVSATPPESAPQYRIAGDDWERQIRTLVRLEDEIERRLGEVLAEMGERGVWRALVFSGAGQYGEERLGVSRSAAEGRARLARRLREMPVLRAAYEDGRIGFEAACLLRRTLDGARPDTSAQEDWIEHAEITTIKRLRDEEILLRRERAAFGSAQDSIDLRPPSDEAWRAARQRRRGDAIERVRTYARAAVTDPRPEVRFHLDLPYQLASDLWTAIQAKKRALKTIALTEQPGTPSGVAAQTFSSAGIWIRDWVAFLGLLEDFLSVWDDPRAGSRRRADVVYERDGWRCSAPGCTSQKNLEEHHIVYRSRGGSDNLTNRICLCRFHHQQGEHGEYARCHGCAPLRVVWSLGRGGAGGTWRNERKWDGGATAVYANRPRVSSRLAHSS